MKISGSGNPGNVARQRLTNQRIDPPVTVPVREAVSWMGAMQAQDYAMVKWAIGLRLDGTTLQTVNRAIDKGEIIRSHLLRPTWHFVSRDDYRWMLSLSVPSIRSVTRSRQKNLEITDREIARTSTIIEKVLTDHDFMTREELTEEFRQAGIPSGDNRYSHLLLRAELDGVICSGPDSNGKYTYSLLDRRVPELNPLSREESLVRLAMAYFRSHGPATLKDFTWWSGLPAGDARKALEANRRDLVRERIGEIEFWHSGISAQAGMPERNRVCLLPAYDEFIVSYRDRSAVLNQVDHGKVISSNGLFRPVILVDGKAAGIWKRGPASKGFSVEKKFLGGPETVDPTSFDGAVRAYARFQEVETYTERPD